MSGALATNFFLEGHATAHRDALRARAAAEGRTLSVENPESKRFQQAQKSSPSQSQPSTQPQQQQQQQQPKKASWWSSKLKGKKTSSATAPQTDGGEADAKSLHSFSSGSEY